MTKSRGINRPKTRWTPVMLQQLREWYPHHTTAVVAGALDVSEYAVNNKAQTLGLRKSAEHMASDRAGRIQKGRQDPRMQATQFKPGQKSWSAGTKGVVGVQPNCRATQFKPGNRPQTWVPVGSYRIVPGGSDRTTLMLERKVNDLPGPNHVRWHPVHRLVWEEANGPVPKGHIVVFKPGMRTTVLEEITLDRLELVSRAEHARRNHPRNISPELGRLVAIKGAITRQVNRIAREAKEAQS